MNRKEELIHKAIGYLREKDLYDIFILYVEKGRVIFDDGATLDKEYSINEMYELIKHETSFTKIEFSKKINHIIRLGFIVYHDFRDITVLNKTIIESEVYSNSSYFEKLQEFEANHENNENEMLIVSYNAYISGSNIYTQIDYDIEMKKTEKDFANALSKIVDNGNKDKSWLKKLATNAGYVITIILFIILFLGIIYVLLQTLGVEIPDKIDDVINNLIKLK